MHPLSVVLLVFLLSFALWFIWPVINPKIAMQQSEAGEQETEESREDLQAKLDLLEGDATANPELLNDAGWLRTRERLWAQLNYLDFCAELNAKAKE